jgi:23S rRNA (cytosine1962-C5)-methyltransferase
MASGSRTTSSTALPAGATFLAHDIFKQLGQDHRAGPYGLVIVDPPSYQKGSFVATKGPVQETDHSVR